MLYAILSIKDQELPWPIGLWNATIYVECEPSDFNELVYSKVIDLETKGNIVAVSYKSGYRWFSMSGAPFIYSGV